MKTKIIHIIYKCTVHCKKKSRKDEGVKGKYGHGGGASRNKVGDLNLFRAELLQMLCTGSSDYEEETLMSYLCSVSKLFWKKKYLYGLKKNERTLEGIYLAGFCYTKKKAINDDSSTQRLRTIRKVIARSWKRRNFFKLEPPVLWSWRGSRWMYTSGLRGRP